MGITEYELSRDENLARICEKRKLAPTAAHLASPGPFGGRRRRDLNLRAGGPSGVITDMAVLGLDATTYSFSCILEFGWKILIAGRSANSPDATLQGPTVRPVARKLTQRGVAAVNGRCYYDGGESEE